jgi:hypothetical protein
MAGSFCDIMAYSYHGPNYIPYTCTHLTGSFMLHFPGDFCILQTDFNKRMFIIGVET